MCKSRKDFVTSIGDKRLLKVIDILWDILEDDIHKSIINYPKSEIKMHKVVLTSTKKKKEPPDHENMTNPKRMRSSGLVYDELKHCMFCGCDCDTERDPKNPSRW